MSRLRAGTGSSALADASAAGREAATAALAGLNGEAPALIVVFASIRYPLDTLVQGIRAVTGDTPLVGATSCGHFCEGAMMTPGEGVAVLAMSAGGYRFGVASGTGLRDDAFEVGRALARTARAAAGPAPAPHAALIVLADGLGNDLQVFLNGIYRVTGAAVPVVGGAAGDDRSMVRTWVLHDDQVLTDAAVAVWVASDRPLRIGCGHGWNPISLPMIVSQADGFVVEKIAGRPALDVYRELVNADTAGEDDVVGTQVWHPQHAFGLIEPDGGQLIRAAYVDAENRLCTFLPLPPYAAVQVVSSRPDSLLDVVDPIVTEALPDDGEAGVVLTFSCVGRYDILGERAAEEPKRLQVAAGSIPTFGFHTYGEFARTVGVSGVHNATLAVIAL